MERDLTLLILWLTLNSALPPFFIFVRYRFFLFVELHLAPLER